MVALTFANSARSSRTAVLLVAARTGDAGPVPLAGADLADAALGGQLGAALAAAGASGKADEVTKIPTLGASATELVVVVGVGVGDADGRPELEAVRRAVGAGVRALSGRAEITVAIGDPDDVELVAAISEGLTLGAYAFVTYKSVKGSAPVARARVRASSTAAARRALERATVIGDAVASIRDQVNATPADLYPESFAALVTSAAREAGCTVQVLDERGLRRGRYGGILGVGQGSVHPPRLVRVTHKPAGAKARVAFVGKGITFDTGGYSLKVPMPPSMKGDMAGASTVLAAVIAAARLGLPVEVTATAALAENKVSANSYLPSDVLTMRNGTTVEVDNTDAEGRLVLADAIVRAAEDDPDLLVEVSTLTGAQLVALGQRVAGVMGSDDGRSRVIAAADVSGEPMWPMPLPADLRPGLDSPIADLRNVSGERYGGMLVGGLFLAEFVPAGLPWAHIDLAGPSWNAGGPHGYTPKGGTGYGLRTLLSVLDAASS